MTFLTIRSYRTKADVRLYFLYRLYIQYLAMKNYFYNTSQTKKLCGL